MNLMKHKVNMVTNNVTSICRKSYQKIKSKFVSLFEFIKEKLFNIQKSISNRFNCTYFKIKWNLKQRKIQVQKKFIFIKTMIMKLVTKCKTIISPIVLLTQKKLNLIKKSILKFVKQWKIKIQKRIVLPIVGRLEKFKRILVEKYNSIEKFISNRYKKIYFKMKWNIKQLYKNIQKKLRLMKYSIINVSNHIIKIGIKNIKKITTPIKFYLKKIKKMILNNFKKNYFKLKWNLKKRKNEIQIKLNIVKILILKFVKNIQKKNKKIILNMTKRFNDIKKSIFKFINTCKIKIQKRIISPILGRSEKYKIIMKRSCNSIQKFVSNRFKYIYFKFKRIIKEMNKKLQKKMNLMKRNIEIIIKIVKKPILSGVDYLKMKLCSFQKFVMNRLKCFYFNLKWRVEKKFKFMKGSIIKVQNNIKKLFQKGIKKITKKFENLHRIVSNACKYLYKKIKSYGRFLKNITFGKLIQIQQIFSSRFINPIQKKNKEFQKVNQIITHLFINFMIAPQ